MNREEMREEAKKMSAEIIEGDCDLPALFKAHLKEQEIWANFLGSLNEENREFFKYHLFQIALLGSKVGSKAVLRGMDMVWEKHGFPVK